MHRRIHVTIFFCVLLLVNASAMAGSPERDEDSLRDLPAKAAIVPGIQRPTEDILIEKKISEACRAYNERRYQEAEKLFEAVISRLAVPSETLLMRRAAAISAQFIPGNTEEENAKTGRRAIAAYEDLLRSFPRNADAHALVAHLFEGLGEIEMQVRWLQRLSEIPDLDPERRQSTYYTIGVIKWNEAYQITTRWMKRPFPGDPAGPLYGLSINGTFPSDERKKAQAAIDMAFEYINRAIALNPDDPNSYSYLSLIYREKAKLTDDISYKRQLVGLSEQVIRTFRDLNEKRLKKESPHL